MLRQRYLAREEAPYALPKLHGRKRGDHRYEGGSEARAVTVRQCCSAESGASENRGLLRLFGRGSSTAFLRTDHDGRSDRARTMITGPTYHFRPLPHLVSLSAIGVAAGGILLGIGFLLLTHPQPAMPSADPVPVAQTPEAHEVTPPGNNDTAQGSPLGLPADKVAASPTPDAPSNRDVPVVHSTAMETALIPSVRVTHARRRGGDRHHHNRMMVSRLPQTEGFADT